MPIQLGIVHGFMGGNAAQCTGTLTQLALTGDMITFTNFPTNIAAPVPSGFVDGSTSTRGYHTDAGSGVVQPETTHFDVDLGADNEQAITKARLYGGTLDTWRIEYSDDGSSWSTAYDGLYVGSTMAWCEAEWDCVGKHRYWRFVKTDVAVTTGTFTTELELYAWQ